MKPERKPQYQVIKTEECIQQLHMLSKSYGRTTDLVNAIEWALSRKPHEFNQLSNDFYLWVTDELTNIQFPTVKIVYKINDLDNTVTVLGVEEK